MRTLLIMFVVIVAAVAVGYGAGAATGWNPHPREMLMAAGVCLVASLAGCVPMLLTRGATQPSVAQAGLLGTVLHLLVCTVIGGGMLIFRPVPLDSAYVFWLLALYWLTLIVVAAVNVHAIRHAPPAASVVKQT